MAEENEKDNYPGFIFAFVQRESETHKGPIEIHNTLLLCRVASGLEITIQAMPSF